MAKQLSKRSLNTLYNAIAELLGQSHQQIARSINSTICSTYYQVGKIIVEHEQQGSTKAVYGKSTLRNLSDKLTLAFGKGFSIDNLENMRKFYLYFSISETVSRKSFQAQQDFQDIESPKTTSSKSSKKPISETASRKLNQQKKDSNAFPIFKLSWSHYIFLMRIDNEAERKFYEIEASNENWSLRELKRQYDTSLYERLVLSRNKKKVKELSNKGHIITQPIDVIKDPYVLEFLGLKEQAVYSEYDLETALIDKIEDFLKELGKGFLFVARQYRIPVEGEFDRIDLVFYHRILRCFVLIDLKLGELKATDLGQIQMYVGYFDDEVRAEGENKTIGIVLCKNKKESIVKYTLPKDNTQIFTSKYKTYLPAKEDLQLLMEPEAEYITQKRNYE